MDVDYANNQKYSSMLTIEELMDCLKSARDLHDFAESQIEKARETLCNNGYCGEGNLSQMIERALKEAKKKGENRETKCHLALMDADLALPSSWEGTVAERIKRLRELKDK